MCVIAVAGCGEVFPSVDSGTADLPAFIAGNSPANRGTVRVSVDLRPTG